MTINVYENGQAPLVGKILVGLYCSSVSAFICTLVINTNGHYRDIASGLSAVGETGEVSGAAQAFIARAADLPSMNLIQMVFVALIILMQPLRVWMKKPAQGKPMHCGFGNPVTTSDGGLSPLFGCRISLIAAPHQIPFETLVRCPHLWHRYSGRRFPKCLITLLMRSSKPGF